MYHALGAAPQSANGKNGQPAAPQFRPPVAPSPGGYQQGGAPGYEQMGTPQPGQAYSSHEQDPGYFPPQEQALQGGINELTNQMGGMGMGGHEVAPVRQKKKDRHAHHNIETPGGSSQAFNGMPQGGVGNQTQYLNQQITPAMNQFPAASNNMYTPGNPTTPMEHAARAGTPLSTGTAVASSQGRVDPEQIPSIPRSRDTPSAYYLEHVYPTMEQHVPPPAAVPFVAFDQGNSSPKYARLTLNNIPSSSEALHSIGLPLGLILQPLAPLQDGEQPIPVLDFGEVGPPRCRRCRAYINPFMTFRGGGNKFVCNMCTFPNDTTSEYFAPTDPSGVRVDRMQRPELTLGTVDFVVPKEYYSKEPVGLRWLFMIDVTEESMNKGFLDGFCEGIMNALYGVSDLPQDEEDEEERQTRLPPGARVGIVTFDKNIHFYNLNSNLERAQMMVMPDIEDPFVPLSDGLFVDPAESKSIITSLLTQLPNMFAGIKYPEPALLPALNAGLSALNATGGRIVCSLGALPTWGPGRLFLRDDGNSVAGTDAEKKLLTTEHPGFLKLANKMVENGVGADFFLAAPSGGFLDVATIGT